ncbi:MAG: hypothetical protein MH321_14785 [Leptospiraceae bacterium]|nr:hypothetical protein [Leptospiraceae bacterium]
MNNKLQSLFKSLLLLFWILNCSTLSIIDPKKPLDAQVPKEKAVYFIQTNFSIENQKIKSVTLEFFDILKSTTNGNVLKLSASKDIANNSLTECYLFSGDKTVYALYTAEIATDKGLIQTQLPKENKWFIEYKGSKSPLYAGSLSYLNNSLNISDSGFKECKADLAAKYPNLDFSNSEELLKKKSK